MRAAEFLTVAYFAYLMLVAARRPLSRGRRIQIETLCSIATAMVLVIARASAMPVMRIARDWVPAVYILIGYWLSGRFYTAPMASWETWLAGTDRWLGLVITRSRLAGIRSRPVLAGLELAYLSVYPLVPAGFALLYFSRTAFDIDRFWTVVLLAELGCYAVLPWIQMRPPRALEFDRALAPSGPLRQLNLFVLRFGSVHANTFPSGHAAGAVATGLAVATWRPVAGSILLGWAAAVVVGSVVGRYHYAADSVLGAAMGVAAWLVVFLIWRG